MMNRLPKLITCSLLDALAVLSTLFCLITAFDLSASVITLIIVSLCASFLFTAGFQNNKLLLSLIPAIIIMALVAAFGGIHMLSNGIQELTHEILTKFSTAYKNVSFSIPAEPVDFTRGCYTLLFSVAACLLSLWLAWGIGYRSCLITIAGTLPFLLLCVTINDTPPSALPLVLMITVWITVLLSADRPNDPGLLDATRLTLLFLSILLVFGCIGIFYPKDDTASKAIPEFIEELLDKLPENMQELLSRDSKGVSSQQLGADTSDSLDLTKQGVRSRTDTIMMQLCSTESGVLYLRGAAKDIYTGTAWESRDQATAQMGNYSHTSLGMQYSDREQAAVQIKNYRDNTETAFMPYGFISCTGAADFSSDLRVSITEDDYIVYFWPGLRTLDFSQPGNSSYGDYDAYVQSTCLDLPSGLAEELYNLAISYGFTPSMSDSEKITWVAALIRSIGTYRLDVACQPSNYDFALYFLTESQQGYCVHYATAACAMYRALGIPARYASGYRVTVTQPGEVTDVTDQDTHAWAEIYLSGYGWIPIETTPGFYNNITLPDIPDVKLPSPVEPEPESGIEETAPEEEPEEIGEAEIVEEEPEPVETPEPSEEPEQAPEEEPEEEPSPSPSPSAEPEQETETVYIPPDHVPQSDAHGSGRALVILLIVLCVLSIPAAIIILMLRRSSVLKRRRVAFYSKNNRLAIISLWSYAEALTEYGAEPPAEVHTIALRAMFSQHEMTDEEANQVRTAVKTLYDRATLNLKGMKRIKFKLISVLEYPDR